MSVPACLARLSILTPSRLVNAARRFARHVVPDRRRLLALALTLASSLAVAGSIHLSYDAPAVKETTTVVVQADGGWCRTVVRESDGRRISFRFGPARRVVPKGRR